MRNINKVNLKPLEFLDEVISSKKKANKDRLKGLRDELLRCYEDYNAKAESGELHLLQTKWVYDHDDIGSDGHFLYHQYDNSSTMISKLRAKLIEENDGKIYLKCPICEIGIGNELDHYAPRQLFPEYSIHPHNLIPICHECNNKKVSIWCDGMKNRLIFNAYFDIVTTDELFTTSLDFTDGLPYIQLSIKDFKGGNVSPRTMLAISTIKELGLLSRQEFEINKLLTKEIEDLKMNYKHWPLGFDDFVVFTRKVMADKIAVERDVNNLHRVLYTTMCTNTELQQWIIRELTRN